MKSVRIVAIAATFILPSVAATAGNMEKKADYWFNQMDANKDGAVSKAEHTSFGDKMFMDADTSKDGNLTKEELLAAKKSEKEKMKDSVGE